MRRVLFQICMCTVKPTHLTVAYHLARRALNHRKTRFYKKGFLLFWHSPNFGAEYQTINYRKRICLTTKFSTCFSFFSMRSIHIASYLHGIAYKKWLGEPLCSLADKVIGLDEVLIYLIHSTCLLKVHEFKNLVTRLTVLMFLF